MGTQIETKRLEYFLTFKVQGFGINTGLEERFPLSFPPSSGLEKGTGGRGMVTSGAGVGCGSGSPTAGRTPGTEIPA